MIDELYITKAIIISNVMRHAIKDRLNNGNATCVTFIQLCKILHNCLLQCQVSSPSSASVSLKMIYLMLIILTSGSY